MLRMHCIKAVVRLLIYAQVKLNMYYLTPKPQLNRLHHRLPK